jgi:RimJ/RimL family protein N-acetyltransferase
MGPKSAPSRIERVKSAQGGYAERTSCKLAIDLCLDGPLVGTCGLTNWSLDHGWAELAYELAVPWWGKGLASRAVEAAVDWAFRDVGFRRIHAMVMTSNSRSIRLLERSGFVLEGTLRSYRVCRGTPRDFHVYSTLRHEWRAGQAG